MCRFDSCQGEVVNGGLCKIHYNKKMADFASEKYYRRRSEWIVKKGGVCNSCGSSESLEFDHIDATTKEYNIAKILSSHSESKVAKEMEKCQLLCKECHLKKTLEEGDIYIVSHGEGLTGKKGCYCELCGPLKSAYNKRYKPVPKRSRSKNPIQHGERSMYTGKHKCRCDLCKQAQSDYMREYNLKNKA